VPSDYQSIQFVDFYVTWNPSLLFDLKSTDSIDEFIIAYRSIDELTDIIEIGKKNMDWIRKNNIFKYGAGKLIVVINESISCKYLFLKV